MCAGLVPGLSSGDLLSHPGGGSHLHLLKTLGDPLFSVCTSPIPGSLSCGRQWPWPAVTYLHWEGAQRADRPASAGPSGPGCEGRSAHHLFDARTPLQHSIATLSQTRLGIYFSSSVSSVQLFSHVWLFATPLIAARQASLSITNSWSLLKLMSIESVRPSNHLILCHPLLLLPSIFPSIRVFANESVLHIRWPKYWSFSFSISPSNEYSGLISFRMDWLDLLAVQGTLKSLLQHHSSKASVLQCSAFFMVQLTSVHPGRLGAPDPRLAAPWPETVPTWKVRGHWEGKAANWGLEEAEGRPGRSLLRTPRATAATRRLSPPAT